MKFNPPIRTSNIKRAVISPMQPRSFDMGTGVNEIILLVRELNALKGEFTRTQKFAIDKLDQKLAEAQTAIEHARTIQKGDPGKDAKVDYEHIISEVKKQIRVPVDGDTPIIDYTKIIDGVVAKMPKVKAQKDVKVDYTYIIAELKTQLSTELSTKATDPMAIIDTIMNLPEGKRIPLRLIDGLEQTISAMRNQLSRGYLHGGGLSAVSHDTTLSGDGTPANPLSVIGGGGATANISTEKLTGTQSGTSVTLDLTQLAHTFSVVQFVTRQGQILTPTTAYTISGDTVTIFNADAATEDYLVQYTYGSTPSTTDTLVTESGDTLITEAGDTLVTES